MALNGSFNSSSYYSSSKEDYISLKFSWTATQDIAANTSTITWDLKCDRTASGYVMGGNFKVVIDGANVFETTRTDRIQLYRNTVIASGTKTLTHTSDGERSFSVSLNGAIYENNRNVSGTHSFTLNTIPRKATVTSAPNFTDEENPTITYSNLAGTKVEALDACISLTGTIDDIKYRPISKIGTSYTFTLTDAEREVLRNATLSGSNYRYVLFYIRTKISGNTYHHYLTKKLTIANSEPVFSDITIRDIGGGAALTNDSGNTLVKGKSVVSYSITAEPQKGATITSYLVENSGNKYTTASGTIYYPTSGNFSVTITDNRGNIVKQEITKPYIDYAAPKCAMSIVDTDTVAGAIDIELSGSWFNGRFGTSGIQNHLTYSYNVYDSNGNTAASGENLEMTNSDYSGNIFNKVFTVTGLNYQDTYTAHAFVNDTVGSVANAEQLVLKIMPVFDWSENDFNFNVPVSIGGVELDYIVEQGTTSGWTYRKWNSGIAECWKAQTLYTAFNTTWGSMYQSDSALTAQNYPLTFKERPVENVNISGGDGYAAWIYATNATAGNSTTKTGTYKLCRPTNVTASSYFYINIYVRGRYK